MIIRCISTLIFFVICVPVNAQKNNLVKGVCINSANEKLANCIITAKQLDQSAYAISNFEGAFSVQYGSETNTSDSVFISIKLIGYEAFDTTMSSQPLINLGDILLIESYQTLNQVLVKTRPVVVSGDTTTLDVAAFSNKLDNNLEDVLRKMPGFDLSSSGDISFNGKRIENIFIEGDELTKNYKQISKNIAPDLLNKVQVIDKYNSNSALKGLSNSNNQILNLTLKNPKKLSVFGTVKGGVGIENRTEAATNLFVLKNKLKSLIIGSKNNTGESPYNEIVSNGRDALVKDYDFDPTLTPDYIQKDQLFSRPLFSNASNTLFNRSNLLVVNNNFKINKKLDLKLFSDLYIDKINQYRTTNVTNLFDPTSSYRETLAKTFKPEYFNNYLQLNYHTAKDRLIVAGSFQTKKYRESQQLFLRSPIMNSISNLYTRNSIGIFYTHRIDSMRAVEILFQNNNDAGIASLRSIQDSSRLIDSIYKTGEQEQSVNNELDFKKSVVKYIYKRPGGFVHILKYQNTLIETELSTVLNLKLDNGNPSFFPSYQNKSILKINESLLDYSASFSLRKINIKADGGVSATEQKLVDEISRLNNRYQQFNVNSDIQLSYNIKKLHFVSVTAGYNNELPDFLQQATNPVLFNYRTLINTSNFSEKINSFKTITSYSYRNFNTGTNLLFYWYHQSRFKGIIGDNLYARDFDYLQNFYAGRTQGLDNFTLNADKYSEKLRLGVSFKNNFLLYSNPVLASGIFADRKFLAYNSSISIRPTFKNDLNASVGGEFSYNKDLNAKVAAYTINPFILGAYSFTDNLSVGTKLNFYRTNFFASKQDYFFGDAFFNLKLPKRKIDIKLNLVNFTNTHGVYSGFKTVFQTRSIETQILPRYALLQFIFHVK